MKRHILVLATVLLFLLFGLVVHTNAGSHQKSDSKKPLYFSLIPKKNVDQQLNELAPLLELLEDKLNRPVKIIRPQSYTAVIEGVLSETIDLAILGPASYAKARARDARVQAFASFARKKGFSTPQGSFYHSILFTLEKTGIREIEGLKKRKIALTDPASTSGAVIPNLAFSETLGASLKEYFGTLIYTGSHDRSIRSVVRGHVDGAFVSSARLDEAVQNKVILPDQVVILWRSKPIHYDPFVFSGAVEPSLRAQIKQIFFSSSPRLDTMLENMKMTGLVKVCDEDYNSIHKIVGMGSQGDL